MATITAFVMMLGLGWAYGADPLICTAGPSLQLVAGTTEVSATYDDPFGQDCRALVEFADPAFTPITYSFPAQRCSGLAIMSFTVPRVSPNGGANIIWTCAGHSSCFRGEISNGTGSLSSEDAERSGLVRCSTPDGVEEALAASAESTHTSCATRRPPAVSGPRTALNRTLTATVLSTGSLSRSSTTSAGIGPASTFIRQAESQPSTRDAGGNWTFPSTSPPSGIASTQPQGSVSTVQESSVSINEAAVTQSPDNRAPTQVATSGETSAGQSPANGPGGDPFAITQTVTAFYTTTLTVVP